MRKLGILVLAMVLVVGMSFGVMASQTFEGTIEDGTIEDDFDVNVKIKQFAWVQVDAYYEDSPFVIDFDEFGEGEYEKKTEIAADLTFHFNDDISVELESRGFQDEDGNPIEALNDWFLYHTIQGSDFRPGETGGSIADYALTWENGEGAIENGVYEDRVQLRYEMGGYTDAGINEDNFYEVQAGNYSDVITMTVSSQ